VRTALSLLVLLPALLAAPVPARAAEEHSLAASVVKVEGSESPEARVFVNGERTVFLVLLPGEPYLYKVDRPGRRVSSLPRASAMVRKDRLRPVDGASEMVLQGGLYADVEGGFTFNTLSGKRVAVTSSVAFREAR
jgi:hypothetical protein